MDFSGWSELDVMGSMVRADGTRVGEGRPAGMHLGYIVNEMKRASGERTGAVEGDQDGVRMQEGFVWELALEYMIAGMTLDEAIELAFKRHCTMLRRGVVTQLRLELDEIHGTPDALNPHGRALWTPSSEEPELESYKATRRTLRKALTADDFATNFWTWIVQESGYLKMAGLRQVRWIVWWVAGDYSKGKGTGPRVMEARARFEQHELDATWAGIRTIAERLRREGRGL